MGGQCRGRASPNVYGGYLRANTVHPHECRYLLQKRIHVSLHCVVRIFPAFKGQKIAIFAFLQAKWDVDIYAGVSKLHVYPHFALLLCCMRYGLVNINDAV